MGAAGIVLEFAVSISYTKDALVGILIDALVGSFVLIIVVAPDNDVDLKVDMRYVKVLTDAMTGLWFAVAVPSEDSMWFC